MLFKKLFKKMGMTGLKYKPALIVEVTLIYFTNGFLGVCRWKINQRQLSIFLKVG